ncbi:MAG TPA: RHS repeat-associated core domain-containing protein, partial [Phycisphaerae bacterium]|nr:RHS repeat-associated core domain-containing protein [Phycisphaerae bacterium]
DANTGDVVERYLYDPYGRRTVLDGNDDADPNVTHWAPDGDNLSDHDNALGHQGLGHDSETGFLQNRNRYHHPTMGRMEQRDFAGYVDGMSLYEREASDPVSLRDPTGLAAGMEYVEAIEAQAAVAKTKEAAYAQALRELAKAQREIDRRGLKLTQNFVADKCPDEYFVDLVLARAQAVSAFEEFTRERTKLVRRNTAFFENSIIIWPFGERGKLDRWQAAMLSVRHPDEVLVPGDRQLWAKWVQLYPAYSAAWRSSDAEFARVKDNTDTAIGVAEKVELAGEVVTTLAGTGVLIKGGKEALRRGGPRLLAWWLTKQAARTAATQILSRKRRDIMLSLGLTGHEIRQVEKGILVLRVLEGFVSAGKMYRNVRSGKTVFGEPRKAAKRAVPIATQKQAGHVPGTPQYANRLKQGKTTSTFFGEKSGNAWTQKGWREGTPTGDPNIKIYDAGVSVGTGPNGGMQTRVRVVRDSKGRIHGTPWGPER